MPDTERFNAVVGFDASDPARAALQEDVTVDVATDPGRSVRTSISRQPHKKGWLLGGVVVAGFATMFWLYSVVTDRMSVSSQPDEPEAEEAEIEQVLVQPDAVAVVDGSKTRMALGDQANDLETFQARQQPPEELPSAPVAAAPPSPQPTASPDPLQVWNQMQSVGSFGQVQVASTSTSAPSNSPSSQSHSPDSSSRLASLVASRQAPASEVPQTPAIDLQLERDFFNGGSNGRTVAAGTMTEGTIQSPAIWSPYDESNGRPELFVIRLSAPLLDTSGAPVASAGSELSVRIERVEPTGYVRMSGVAIAREVAGTTEQIPLPEGSVSVRGEGGEALLARGDARLDPGGDIAAMDAGLFAIGGLGKVGELLNRADSVQTNSFSGFGGSSFSSSVDNGDTNIVGGILEGGANAILPGVQQRNQRAINEALDREQIWVVEAGTAVTVVVNQELRL